LYYIDVNCKLKTRHKYKYITLFQAKFLPLTGDTHIVSCGRDGQVRLGELSSTGACRATRRLGQHRGPAHKLAIQQETPHVFLSSGEDGLIMSIDVRDSKADKYMFILLFTL